MNTKRRTVSSPPTVHGPLQPSVVRRLSLVHSLQSTTSPRCGVSGHLASDVAAYSLRSGFTLIELLVVIVVIAILMGITLPVSKYAIYRAKAARQEVMLAKIRSALDDYRATYGEYPITPPNDNWTSHYPANYATYDATNIYSRATNVSFATNTVEIVKDADENPCARIDYGLTYPLMFKQLDKGARPFMIFDILPVVYLVLKDQTGDRVSWSIRRRSSSGWRSIPLVGIYGDAVNRAEAIDPVSKNQWLYTCTNGLNYILATNGF